MISPALRLEHRQNQVLTPRLQQAVRLLQISTQEFNQTLQQMLSINPFLDCIDEESDTHDGEAEPEQEEEAEVPTDADRLEIIARDERFDPFTDCAPWGARKDSAEGPHEETWRQVPAERTLREHLHQQWRTYPLSEREWLIGAAVIEALDEDGYLRVDLSELRALLGLKPPVGMSEMHIALKLVQSLDPPGVGCRDVRECLRLQLQNLPDSEARAMAIAIVDGEFERFVRRDMTGLGKRLACPQERLELGCAMIRQLAPRPGRPFGANTPPYLVPDVFVHKEGGAWRARLNPAAIPNIGINQTYVQMFRRHRQSHHQDMAAYLHEARWTVRNIEQRFNTILRVAEEIVARQQRFFEQGALAMQPLGLRDIAANLGLHESTVSRATCNKYLAAPAGILELKYFFSRALHTLHGSPCSSIAIRDAIRRMIRDEDRNAPLSDAAITRFLTQQGLSVARRTVTKYRQAMQLPPMEMRRGAV